MTLSICKHGQEMKAQKSNADIVSLAWQKLESHPHFHHHCRTIHIERAGQRLVLSGQLPSFYLKQLVQQALKCLEVRIDNQIEVICSDGVSSPC